MDLQWLDDVLFLLEERNLTRAAARRHITQPAFSRRIRSFEDWLGVDVLERGTNRVEISRALISNEAEIRALVARIRDLRGKITHFDPISSTVSIAAQHAPVFSTFPDMALRAKQHFPGLRFRLRAANLPDCVTMFLRGDTSMMLCYESEKTGPLSFGPNIRRALWGIDYLIPVVGGQLRYTVKDNGETPDDVPAIVYPENSYFGEVLSSANRRFGTPAKTTNTVCETALSSGIKELVLKGIGIGWLPYSMAYREIESGDLVSLSNNLGREALEVAVYADIKDDLAVALADIWKSGATNGKSHRTATSRHFNTAQ
ncbi:LysR family transcriptional regulator [Yoonia sediminilitoris]|uniref:DNA-binding transcriptional LysR family regulator n=1 Tax=Yoonia sediminilitoris TaxID=1286148 RepID=A0A2T6KAG4_9RHOB|nr:LysR substrate-binding domain-containing protein [Yoonia sediminilitoris]PUB11809.1 DNA-binding transcriptional LysR family regulator [Yoonia sediminilitoris]RCW91886.1 DNA-binding transcriptional LysR family regulator [Yoonia sediminilitoris]